MVTRTLVFGVLIVLLVYGAIEAWPLVAGPSISITSPTDGETVPGGVLNVSGTALRTSSLTLDGAQLLPDAVNGHFATVLAFPPGASILTFVARDRFGRSRTTTRTIYVPN
jgi:hypothetical protein